MNKKKRLQKFLERTNLTWWLTKYGDLGTVLSLACK